jgi:histidinol-phosphate aminotransferase
VKPLDDKRLGPGYMRITTALPEDNRRFVAALEQILLCGGTAMEPGR